MQGRWLAAGGEAVVSAAGRHETASPEETICVPSDIAPGAKPLRDVYFIYAARPVAASQENHASA
jgi:hypothetical protein